MRAVILLVRLFFLVLGVTLCGAPFLLVKLYVEEMGIGKVIAIELCAMCLPAAAFGLYLVTLYDRLTQLMLGCFGIE